MAKLKMALCTKIPDELLEQIKEKCDVIICGELKHGKGHVNEVQTRKECMGAEIIVLGDEVAGKETIEAWVTNGMKFIGVAKGTPVTVNHEAIKNAGLSLSYTPGRNAVAVAEFTIGLMIAATRRLTISSTGLSKGEHLGPVSKDLYNFPQKDNVIWGPLDEHHPYTDYGIGFEMYGKRLGIAGYGAIGREVAMRGKAFGMAVLVYDPYCNEERVKADGMSLVALSTMLSESDIVSLHLPVLSSTRNIVDKTWFSQMKSTSYLINTARAAIIHQKDLIEALENNVIAGAALDVFWQEPIPSNHPLLNMRNVTLTPHMAGLTVDVDNWSGKKIGSEVLAYLNNQQRQYLWKL